MEHENIVANIRRITYLGTQVKKQLLIGNIPIIENANEAYKQLNQLKQEIDNYIDMQLAKINLRECCLFLNAFNRHFNKRPFTNLFPEETNYEINFFDKEIDRLLKMD